MINKGIITTILIVLICAIGCVNNNDSKQFKAIADSYFEDKNKLNPLEATVNGFDKYNAAFVFEMTDKYRAQQQLFFNNYQQQLTTINLNKLSEEEKISYKIIQWETNIGKSLLQHKTNLIPLNQFWGTHLTMTQFASTTAAQPFKTTKDYDNFLKRLDSYSIWIDSAMVYFKKGIQQKTVLPKALTLKIIPQFEEQITPKVEDNIFYSAIKNIPASFSVSDKKRYTHQYQQLITQKLMPRYRKMVGFLKNEYLPACRNTSGIGVLPDGDKLYQTYVKQWTTTNKRPQEIHTLGLKEVARIKKEMEIVKAQVGFKGTIIDFFDHIRNKKELMPFKTPEQVIANFNTIYKKIKPNVNKLFALQPKTDFAIRRVESFREKTASAEYVQGSTDGTRPGIFYVPIPDVTKYNYYGDEDLFLHEAIPGHHFQVSLQQENTSLPNFRRFNWFGAYGEGWALYAESLGKELGLYQDPYQYFGMLGNEMHRAIRLVVDTGIHNKGWTREQAIAYSLANEAESQASIIAEVERYMAIPGQALSYKIGQLKIIELREKAQIKAKDRFNIKTFHQKILESGVLPLQLLEDKINHWIISQ